MALLFASSSSEYGSATPAATAYPFSMSCWFRIIGGSGLRTLMELSNSASASNRDRCMIGVDSADLAYMRAASNSGITATTVGSALSSSTWYFLAGVFQDFDDRSVHLGVAGTVTSATSATSRTPSGINTAGIARSAASTPANYFDGDIAYPTLYNTSLGTAEIAALAKGFSPFLVVPHKVIGHWRMTSTTSEPDMSKSGNTMTWTNTPALADNPPIIHRASARRFGPPAAAAAVSEILASRLNRLLNPCLNGGLN